MGTLKMGNTSTKPSKQYPTTLPPRKNGLFTKWENRFQDPSTLQQKNNPRVNGGKTIPETLEEARKRRKRQKAERAGLLADAGFRLGEAGVGLGQAFSADTSGGGGAGAHGGHSTGGSACGGGGSSGGGGSGGHSSSGGGSGCGGGGGGGGGGC
ncbi:hypothetical protein I302_106727 [Kwoniella bestiolae CBS 10118]|uniref:Uncharacterized protein n=1 Tax=Kwoniella bestiolae CBS 10118 TaxID=1296100 RepID=A0A1B9G0K3_9TREE|nr:hypothetical protein I302_06009 [Kwoniella bestiolae CBS 10118]OCF24548.1 hypothetical protein I302_06009 [Kwoniella bestiolae CBS 10118]